MQDTPIINANNADIAELLDGVEIAKLRRGQRYPFDRQTGEKYRYLDIVTALDFETSTGTLKEGDTQKHSWVYIWQWQIGERYTVIGRTMEDFVSFAQRLIDYLATIGNDVRMLCYVHKLEFDFAFISGVWAFTDDDIFATDVRKPLYAKMGTIELRCSWRLSDYSLDDWCAAFPADHNKLKMRYDIARYPWDELSPDDLQYCVNDVICIVERVEILLKMYGDNLYSIPYTNTGYVRRDVRRVMRHWSFDGMAQMQDDLPTYKRLIQAFRGADCHASRFYCTDLLADVYEYDISSAYPSCLCYYKYPMTRFRPEHDTSFKNLQFLLDSGRAVLLKMGFRNIRLKDWREGSPYIADIKCREKGHIAPIKAKIDAGRILQAEYIELTLTDIDLEIISEQYEWEENTEGKEELAGTKIYWMMSARYGYLPRPLVDLVVESYKTKTRLKGDEKHVAEYNHSKKICASYYGLFAQRVIQNQVSYNDGRWKINDIDERAEYAKAIEHQCTRYAWGVWCCAWCRLKLRQAQKVTQSAWGTGADVIRTPFVYSDTDSIKSLCEVDFSAYNRERIKDAREIGAFETDTRGTVHYMGTMEFEDKADLFRTLGGKRYAKVIGGVLEISVSGVPKERGTQALKFNGGIEAFNSQFYFEDCEKPAYIYNDFDNISVKINGHKLNVTRNVVIINVPVEMRIDKSYRRTLEEAHKLLDRYKFEHYNEKW